MCLTYRYPQTYAKVRVLSRRYAGPPVPRARRAPGPGSSRGAQRPLQCGVATLPVEIELPAPLAVALLGFAQGRSGSAGTRRVAERERGAGRPCLGGTWRSTAPRARRHGGTAYRCVGLAGWVGSAVRGGWQVELGAADELPDTSPANRSPVSRSR